MDEREPAETSVIKEPQDQVTGGSNVADIGSAAGGSAGAVSALRLVISNASPPAQRAAAPRALGKLWRGSCPKA
jgi:hypothetical protein